MEPISVGASLWVQIIGYVIPGGIWITSFILVAGFDLREIKEFSGIWSTLLFILAAYFAGTISIGFSTWTLKPVMGRIPLLNKSFDKLREASSEEEFRRALYDYTQQNKSSQEAKGGHRLIAGYYFSLIWPTAALGFSAVYRVWTVSNTLGWALIGLTILCIWCIIYQHCFHVNALLEQVKFTTQDIYNQHSSQPIP